MQLERDTSLSARAAASIDCQLPKRRRLNEDFQVPGYATPFLNFMWPMANEYVSPLNAIFLVQIIQLSAFNQRRYWLIRDGLVPLVFFFKVHPKPEGVRTRLFIEESVAFVVPEAWRPLVGTYRVTSSFQPADLSKTLFCGLAAPHHQEDEELREQLNSLDGENLRKRENSVYLPTRPYFLNFDETFPLRYLSILTSAVGSRLQPLAWSQVNFRTHFSGYELIELNGKRLVADSYIAHLVLARGAFIRSRPRSESERWIPLSPFHGLALKDRVEASGDAAFSSRLENDPRNQIFPWSTWFGGWHGLEQSGPV